MSAPGIGSNFAGGLILPWGKGLVLLFLFYSERGACALGIPGKLSCFAASASSWPPLLHARLNWETKLLFFASRCTAGLPTLPLMNALLS